MVVNTAFVQVRAGRMCGLVLVLWPEDSVCRHCVAGVFCITSTITAYMVFYFLVHQSCTTWIVSGIGGVAGMDIHNSPLLSAPELNN